MEPDSKHKNDPADTSLKEDLSIDTTSDPSSFLWDTSFKEDGWLSTGATYDYQPKSVLHLSVVDP